MRAFHKSKPPLTGVACRFKATDIDVDAEYDHDAGLEVSTIPLCHTHTPMTWMHKSRLHERACMLLHAIRCMGDGQCLNIWHWTH
jgi:hypothetical protein